MASSSTRSGTPRRRTISPKAGQTGPGTASPAAARWVSRCQASSCFRRCSRGRWSSGPSSSAMSSVRGLKQRQQLAAFVKQRLRTVDLELQQLAVAVVTAAVADLLLGDAESAHRVGGQVDPVALDDVAADVLPEVGQLQGGAGL